MLQKYDVLLIADEVVTGFGRLGTMFGSDHYGIKPDLITIAKGLTSAYAPLSGVIVSEKVWQVLVQGSDTFGSIGHGWTYSAHPICAAAGVANLELIDETRPGRQCRRRPAPISARSSPGRCRRPPQCRRGARRRHAGGGRVRRATGTTASSSMPREKIGPQVAAALLERGVIGRAMPQGDILGFAPPLCLTREEADTVVAAARAAVEAVT